MGVERRGGYDSELGGGGGRGKEKKKKKVQLSWRDGSVLQITSALTPCISESLAGIPALPFGAGI